jgi:hypothetical protein
MWRLIKNTARPRALEAGRFYLRAYSGRFGIEHEQIEFLGFSSPKMAIVRIVETGELRQIQSRQIVEKFKGWDSDENGEHETDKQN